MTVRTVQWGCSTSIRCMLHKLTYSHSMLMASSGGTSGGYGLSSPLAAFQRRSISAAHSVPTWSVETSRAAVRNRDGEPSYLMLEVMCVACRHGRSPVCFHALFERPEHGMEPDLR